MFQVPSKAMEIQGSPQFLFSESLEPSGNLRQMQQWKHTEVTAEASARKEEHQ